MYFTCYQAAKNVQGSGWNNSVFYLDLDTMEYGKLFSTELLVSTVVVYDGCLYFQYLKESYMQYDGYLLNKIGGYSHFLLCICLKWKGHPTTAKR